MRISLSINMHTGILDLWSVRKKSLAELREEREIENNKMACEYVQSKRGKRNRRGTE